MTAKLFQNPEIHLARAKSEGIVHKPIKDIPVIDVGD